MSTAPGPKARHNLPVQLNSFIGRQNEISEINSLLSEARLVTLTGSGGAGKTRLAQEIGLSRLDAYPDGVWFTGLAPLSDPGLLLHEIASAIDVGEEALYEYLKDKSALLILDNCEHLVGGCAEFANVVLQRAPGIGILATSQEALDIPGEVVHRVPSLTVPASANASLEALSDCEAVRLFAERAVAVQPSFALTEKNAKAAAHITQRLDGIPLAIELAAARANVLSAEQIAERLDDCFRLLARGRRTALPRHQTLRGTVEWSYDLLSEPERLLFNRLSVFRGGFTLEAAEHVCSGEGLDSYEVLDVLSQLVGKSLVVVGQGPDSDPRYRLLEVLRLYGRERLAEKGEAGDVHRRHAAFFLSVAETAGPELITSKQVTWLNRLESDYDNFRSAMAWVLDLDQGEDALRMAGALAWFWIYHRRVADGQEWLERAVLHAGDAPPRVRARALARGAVLHANKLTDFDRLNRWLEESLDLCQEDEWPEGIAEVLLRMGSVACFQSELGQATKCVEEAWPLLERRGFASGLAWASMIHGWATGTQGRDERATALFERGLAYARRAGGHFNLAYLLVTLGGRALHTAQYERAESHYRESLPLFRDNDDLTGTACALCGLGNTAWLQGKFERAFKLYEESLANFRDSREGSSIAFCLVCLAGGVHPREGLQRLVQRHNERLDLPPDVWARSVIADTLDRVSEGAKTTR